MTPALRNNARPKQTPQRKQRSRLAGFRQHRVAAANALTDLAANPGTAVLSMLVIGITLALPIGLKVLHDNVMAITNRLATELQASLFLDTDIARATTESLLSELRGDGRLTEVKFIDNDTALRDFTRSADLTEIVTELDDNPLPHVIVVTIIDAHAKGETGRRLRGELAGKTGVADVQFDSDWVYRIQAWSRLATRAITILALILGLGVVLITGNTIRVGIHHRRDEIEVAKLCGATDAFVRQPFLYSGAVQGLGGAVVGLMMVFICLAALRKPILKLAVTYGESIQFLGISGSIITISIVASIILGWLGAGVAVSTYLRRIDVTRTN